MGQHLRVSVVVLLALVTPATSETGLALALARVDVASLAGRAHRVAVASLAALTARDLPVVLDTTEQESLIELKQALKFILQSLKVS